MEGLVAHDARVVDDDVDPPEGVESRLHDGRPTFSGRHAVTIGDRDTAGGFDLLSDGLRRGQVRADAGDAAAEIVHQHARAA